MAASSGAIPQKNHKRADRRKEMTSEGVSRGYSEKPLSGNIDYPFLIILMTLLALGILMMFSASYAWAIQERAWREHIMQKNRSQWPQSASSVCSSLRI